jgi:ribosomal protein L11 methyltransferase
MRYIEVKIYTTQEGIDPLTCILMDMGIAGFAIEDARDFQDLMNKKNAYDWDYIDESLLELEYVRTSVTFYLEETKNGSEILEQLQEQFGSELVWKAVEDSDWKDNWKDRHSLFFQTIKSV